MRDRYPHLWRVIPSADLHIGPFAASDDPALWLSTRKFSPEGVH